MIQILNEVNIINGLKIGLRESPGFMLEFDNQKIILGVISGCSRIEEKLAFIRDFNKILRNFSYHLPINF